MRLYTLEMSGPDQPDLSGSVLKLELGADVRQRGLCSIHSDDRTRSKFSGSNVDVRSSAIAFHLVVKLNGIGQSDDGTRSIVTLVDGSQ